MVECKMLKSAARGVSVLVVALVLMIVIPAFAHAAERDPLVTSPPDGPYAWAPVSIRGATTAGSPVLSVSSQDAPRLRDGDHVSVSTCARCSTVLAGGGGTELRLDAAAETDSTSAVVVVGLARYSPRSSLVVETLGAGGVMVGAAARGYGDWSGIYDGPGRWPSVSALKVISSTGGRAATFAARLSDNPVIGGLTATETVTILTVQDRKPREGFGGGWGMYTQANLLAAAAPLVPGLGFIQHEDSIFSEWVSPQLDPFQTNLTGYTENFRPDCGIGTGSANDCSAAIHIISNGARYRSGIIFSADALDTGNGSKPAPAIALAPWHEVAWYRAPGQIGWSIMSTARSGNHHLDLRDANGIGDMFLDSSSITLSGSPSSASRAINFATDSSPRWQLAVTPDAESDSGGADFVIRRFDDSGRSIGAELRIDRSTGVAAVRMTKLNLLRFAALPACNAASSGTMAYVVDALKPVVTWHQKVTAGGGHYSTFVQCTGTGWLAF